MLGDNVHNTFSHRLPGPAHAVYFGTYEIIKEMAGGNKTDGKHHPFAAGMEALHAGTAMSGIC